MKKNKIMNIIFWGVFIFYLILMLQLFFLREQMELNAINLTPFRSITAGIYMQAGFQYIDVQVWGNVLVFVPAGIYVMILSKKNSMLKAFLILFLTSLSVETIQYTFRIGAGDIDDVILNSLGGIIGILLYCLLKKICKTKEKVKEMLNAISFFVGVIIWGLTLVLFRVNFL